MSRINGMVRLSQSQVTKPGNVHGCVTVVGPLFNVGKIAWFVCECTCGNVVALYGGQVSRREMSSCGDACKHRLNDTIICGDVVYICFANGRRSAVDRTAWNSVKRHHFRDGTHIDLVPSQRFWTVSTHGYVTTYLGGSRTGNRKVVRLHRLLAESQDVTDHIDGDKLNNRLSNLRDVSQRFNTRASRKKAKGTTSRYRGVSWNATRGKWFACINALTVTHRLGVYDTEAEAARARDRKWLELGHPKEGLNFPEEQEG